jgi:tRNA (mo5U34)-methyltransferase
MKDTNNELAESGKGVDTVSSKPTPEEIRQAVDAVQYWWHSIDVGHGILTPGLKWRGAPEFRRQELEGLHLPSLQGKTVLDIGAYDGLYSFEAERRGASRVVAIDHWVWLNVCGGPEPKFDFSLSHLPPDGLPPAGAPLPGKRPFDTAHKLLQSKVEPLVADFRYYDLDRLGTFDVALYLGVLYHMEEPLTAMRRVAKVTRELAVIESEAMEIPGRERLPLLEFIPGSDLNNDPTNWWVPNLAALRDLALSAGFSHAEVVDTNLHYVEVDTSLPQRNADLPPVEQPPAQWPPLLERIRRLGILRSRLGRSLVGPLRPALQGLRWTPAQAPAPGMMRGRATLHAWK